MADKPEKELKQDAPASGITAADYVSNGNETPQQQTQYDFLRNQSARDLLSANVQTQIAHEVASQNLNKGLQQGGLNNSGYGATAQAMLGNKYQNQMNINYRDYLSRQNQIGQQEQTALEQEAAAKATNLMDGLQMYGTTPATMEQYLKDHGFEINDGKLTYNGNEGFTDYMVSQVQDYYNAVMNNSGLGVNSTGYTDPYELFHKDKTTEKVRNEIYELFYKFAENPPAEGYVARLINGSDNSSYINLMYHNGKWYQVSDSVYDNADISNKTTLKGSKNYMMDYAKKYR